MPARRTPPDGLHLAAIALLVCGPFLAYFTAAAPPFPVHVLCLATGLIAALGVVYLLLPATPLARFPVFVAAWLLIAWLDLLSGESPAVTTLYLPLFLYAAVTLLLDQVVLLTAAVIGSVIAIHLALGLPFDRPLMVMRLFVAPMAPLLAAWLQQQLREAQRGRREAEAVAAANRALLAWDVRAALDGVVAAMVELLRPDQCFVYVKDEAGRQLLPLAFHLGPRYQGSEEWEALKTLPFPLDRGLTGWVATTGEALLTDDMGRDPRFDTSFGRNMSGVSAIVVPLGRGENVLGSVRVSRVGRGRFAADDLEVARRLADEAAVAIEQARLKERLERDASTDSLTGLPNLRTMERRLEEEVVRARRFGHPLSLAMIDCDGLKRLNDQAGHARGDELIRRLAFSLAASMRQTDALFRYGGDEFVLLLPETELAAAVAAVERLRQIIAARPILDDIGTTLSAGVAELLPWDGAKGLLLRADEALYQAKRGGKDRVVAAGLPAAAGQGTDAGR